MSETPKDFARAKRGPDCLSHWQLSQWAMGVAGGPEVAAFEAHVTDCAHCRARWATEQANHAAAAYAPLPDALKNLPTVQPVRRFSWSLAARWGYALAAALLVVTLGPTIIQRLRPEASVRLKGIEALAVARLRDGTVTEGLWREMQPMQPGDQVRFKAHTGTASWQGLYLRGADGAWQKIFVGMVAADDWVPAALTVNAGAASPLRLLVCPVTPAAIPDDATVPEGCAGYDAAL